MTHGAMVAIHAAQAAAAQARARVIDAFRVQGATAPERARPLAELGIAETDSALKPLLEHGLVRAVDARGRAIIQGSTVGRASGFYLDEAAVIAQRDRKRTTGRRAVWLLIAVLGALGLLLLGVQAGR